MDPAQQSGILVQLAYPSCDVTVIKSQTGQGRLLPSKVDSDVGTLGQTPVENIAIKMLDCVPHIANLGPNLFPDNLKVPRARHNRRSVAALVPEAA
jgi:hypothetical protein